MRMTKEGGSIFEKINHDLHRKRRAAANPFFTKRAIQSLKPVIQAKTDIIVSRLRDFVNTGEVVDMSAVYTGLTMRVISQYCFGESTDSLKEDHVRKDWINLFHQGGQINIPPRLFPHFIGAVTELPNALIKMLNSNIRVFASFNQTVTKRVHKILAENESEKESQVEQYRTIFHNFLASDELPPSEKTEERLTAEAGVFLGAETETTARALSYITFKLLENPDMI